MSVEEDRDRYVRAAHAVQSGVAMEHARGSNDGSPKHLRTGLNMARADLSGLATLLIAKGVITEEEYVKAVADAAEREQKLYEERLMEALGGDTKITLG